MDLEFFFNTILSVYLTFNIFWHAEAHSVLIRRQ
jgi:hypothetical protein